MPVLSVVVPAYNAAASISAALESVGRGGEFADAIVVDDGSEDAAALARTVAQFPFATLVKHDRNRGMCAARNTGIRGSTGKYVTILDADDRFVADWLDQFQALADEWPAEANVCFAACRTEQGEITSAEPSFRGLLTLDDLLNERHSGEYLPIFRGDYLRSRGYVDIGTQKSCGILSYLRFAQDAPFWVTDRVLRIYHSGHPGSVSAGWTEPRKALETVECYDELFRRHRALYASAAPRAYRTKQLRYALYLSFARRPGAWSAWRNAAHPTCFRESVATLGLLLMGPSASAAMVRMAKRFGLIRRYG